MVPAGSFQHLFKNVGVVYVNTAGKKADEIELQAIDAGAADTTFQGELLQIITDPQDLQKIKENLEKKGVEIDNAGLIFIPVSPVTVDEHIKIDYEKILEKLDELDDVQEIYDNI